MGFFGPPDVEKMNGYGPKTASGNCLTYGLRNLFGNHFVPANKKEVNYGNRYSAAGPH